MPSRRAGFDPECPDPIFIPGDKTMSSILTNMSAMSAVASLAATQKSLAQTENEISTGLKVSSASDNAAYWSISTSMKSDVGALSAVSDALNLGSSVIGTATSAITQSITTLNSMKDLVVSAQQAGVNQTTVDGQIKELQGQLRSYANSASFNGVNLLATSSTTANVVTSFSRDAKNNVTVGTTNVALATALYSGVGAQGATAYGTGATPAAGLLDKADTSTVYTANDGTTTTGTGVSIDDLTTSGKSADALQALSSQIENAITSLTAAASSLGASSTNLTDQNTYIQSLSDSLTTGVGSLVDADMNEASTRLSALQTQQQLGVQALSVANQNSQLILKLFQ